MSILLSYTLADGVATIALDDGKANVMSVDMLRAIGAALDRAEADKAVVVLRGRDGMFSGGFDLGVFKREPAEVLTMLQAGAELTHRLLSFPYPVLAVATGHAVAMGVFILLSADHRIGCSPEARVQANEVQIGMTLPYFAIEVCRQRLAPAHFNLATLTAAPYSQQQAVAAGFLDELVTAEALPTLLATRTTHLRKLHMESHTATKQRLREHTLAALREAIDRDVAGWRKQFPGKDDPSK